MAERISRLFAKRASKIDPVRGGSDGGLREQDAKAFCDTYEGLGLGGFWSTDSEGCVTYLSHKVAETLPDQDCNGRHLTELFAAAEGGDDTIRNLQFYLVRKSRFEKLVVRSTVADEVKWWSISGEPQFDKASQFIGFRGHCADITGERQMAEEASQLAMHDPLTGLLNRRSMARLLDLSMLASKLQNRKCATFLIDLDRFKQVNDTLGHSVGDLLLKQVAERLLRIVTGEQKVCRLGGDEFQVLLPDQQDRGALGDLAERIIAMLSQPYTVEGNRCLIGASVGIAISPFDGQNADEFVRNADLALYAAKNSGRGRFRFFSHDMLNVAEERRKLDEDLQDALTRGELELLYQPVVGAASNRVTGAEALIRWKHPEKGMISPGHFIPIAEESSLICRIGTWILRQACEDAVKWPSSLRVAVNVSPVQFIEPSFIGNVTQSLAATGLDPDRLEIEITEGVFLQENGTTDAIFQKLKSLGVRLALDDFGTGYSSLAYLKTAPFDKIKIDQSFVQGATLKGSRSRAIITAIVALADALGMETTAEGIETFDQLEMIREQGISHVQGYIYSKPISQDEYLVQSTGADWGIEPSGHAIQRHERVSMYRKVGAVHEDYYYPVVLKNLSATGAMIEGIMNVPVGTQFVLDFGEGQLAVATVRRSRKDQQGVEFEVPLVSDGFGGLCTNHRVSTYLLSAAGVPYVLTDGDLREAVKVSSAAVVIPSFEYANEKRAVFARGDRAA